MPLQKTPININFNRGIETKTDPYQLQIGQFADLENVIFKKSGQLTKRNGYAALTAPSTLCKYVTTFNGNLTAIGSRINAYSAGSNTWVDKGAYRPVSLNTLPLVRSNTNQTQADSVVAANGLVCTVYTDLLPNGSGGQTAVMKYVVADSITGQNIIAPTVITPTSGTVLQGVRVFLLGNYFVIVFGNNISGTKHLQYIAISTANPSTATANVDISSQYSNNGGTVPCFDGVVANNNLYLAWNGSDVGGAIRMTYIDSILNQHVVITKSPYSASVISLAADTTGTTPVIYTTYYDIGSSNIYCFVTDQQLTNITSPQVISNVAGVGNYAMTAQNGAVTIVYEVNNSYSYGSTLPTHYLAKAKMTQAGAVTGNTVLIRSLGLASKGFLYNGTMFMLGIYYSAYQPTYFLIDSNANIFSKLAYSNGGDYLNVLLPSVTVNNNSAYIAYLVKDLVQAANKNTTPTNTSGIYSQVGINLASFDLTPATISSAEIGQNLNFSGGFLWNYDGYIPVENGFFVWPDNVYATWSATGGSIVAKPDGSTNTNAYYYVATYEWSDNNGNINRSAPSVPLAVTTTGAGTAGSITLKVPTLRLTYKTANPVKIVLYRWSVAQQVYYQVTSISSPILNDLTVDNITYVDTLSDSSIIGNNILYTTGGVIENISPPATDNIALYRSRLFMVDAEDRNLLWYSKQVIENTPIEMSDLFTVYVSPTTAAQGNTGIITALSAMDDKLIIFKKDAIYYLTGNGPDNTGANNDFSEPVFITGTVGCVDEKSIVFMPNGLMFQSDKGIWLLGRDLSTSYIGAPVEAYNDFKVLSALTIPGTNEVRFTLDSGVTLMYDYYQNQWGTFTNIPAIDSTILDGLHTFINSAGIIYQETPGLYLDGTNPVNISFKTGWINLNGLQGYERAYFFYLLATYLSPHRLSVEIAYDYNPSPVQNSVITPDNYSGVYGSDSVYGGGTPYGGSDKIEQWRIFLAKQKCEAFQITISEIFDASYGTQPGAGLTISGIDLIVGSKSGYPRLPAARQIG